MASCRKSGQPLAESGRLSFHLHDHGSRAVKHHASQILVAQLADAEQSRLATGRVVVVEQVLTRLQGLALSEADAVADGRNQCCRNDWSEAWHLHQAMAAIVLLGDPSKLRAGFFDFSLELVPLLPQLTNQMQQTTGKRRIAITDDDLQLAHQVRKSFPDSDSTFSRKPRI